MNDERQTMTLNDAMAVLPADDTIHAVFNPKDGILLGASWEREDVLELLQKVERIEVTGQLAQKDGYGIAVLEPITGDWLFIKTTRRTDNEPVAQRVALDPARAEVTA